MKNKRIYSISTVGIRNHYNQDYLIHAERTDFTGSNGAGKSILADLLQLMFIYEDKQIAFGTDGLKKKLRSPYTLPIGTSEAYAFLNIEVSEGLFITIGVAIPNQKGRRIKPFVIANDPDLNKSLVELAFTADKLLFSKHFIKEGRFLTIEELSVHFRDTYSLYFKYFTFKEEKDEYYSFLFNKDILSINLTIESNLGAFAKIIQSFSKAKTLTIDNSESLQEFLFENNKAELEESFSLQKAHLERLLKDYKNLEDYIRELEGKQSVLVKLKRKEEEKRPAHIDFLIADVQYASKLYGVALTNYEKSKALLDEDVKEEIKLSDRQPKINRLVLRSKAEHEQAKINSDIYKDYKKKLEDIDKIKVEADSILNESIPTLNEEIGVDVNIDRFQTEEILRRIHELMPVLSRYKTLAAMSEKVAQQKEALNNYRQAIHAEILEAKELLELMSLNKKDTLFSKVLERAEKLSVAQETVLFYLIDVYWSKPQNAQPGSKYTTELDILAENAIQADEENKGYWLRTGALNLFVPQTPRKPLFSNPSMLRQAIATRKKELEEQMVQKQDELKELDKFERGQIYNAEKIRLNYSLDQELKDYSAFQEFEKSAKLAQNIGQRLQQLQSRIKQQNEGLLEIRSKHAFTFDDLNIDGIIEKHKNMLSVKETRAADLGKVQVKEDSELKNLAKNIPEKRKRKDEALTNTETARSLYIEKDANAKEHIRDIAIDLSQAERVTEQTLKEKEENFKQIKEDYITEYKAIVGQYDETKSQKNPEINEQIDEKRTYQFLILEKVLLGPKIKHLDNISEELREANRSRLSMADAIHETMLKIFTQTKNKYNEYKRIVEDLNVFFKGKKISQQYYFQINFTARKEFSIDWINRLQNESQTIYKPGELPFGSSVEQFIEDFFKKATKYTKKLNFSDLLDPKTYFLLEAVLTDQQNTEIPGSTGETYAALVLLGIGRLSKVQSENKKGIKFIILEETANLDKTNFNTFPNIAAEFGYQIITMTPKPYGSDSEGGWYLHHLIKGKTGTDINYPIPSSYFKTNDNKTDLFTYLKNV